MTIGNDIKETLDNRNKIVLTIRKAFREAIDDAKANGVEVTNYETISENNSAVLNDISIRISMRDVMKEFKNNILVNDDAIKNVVNRFILEQLHI